MRTRNPLTSWPEDAGAGEDAPDAAFLRPVLAVLGTLFLAFLATGRFERDAAFFAAAIFKLLRATDQS
jgi:hypothetical protein